MIQLGHLFFLSWRWHKSDLNRPTVDQELQLSPMCVEFFLTCNMYSKQNGHGSGSVGQLLPPEGCSHSVHSLIRGYIFVVLAGIAFCLIYEIY